MGSEMCIRDSYGGIISGDVGNSLLLDGGGTIVLNGANTFDGPVRIRALKVRVSNSNALGVSPSLSDTITVYALCTLELTGGITIPKGINLAYATLASISGDNSCTRAVTIMSNSGGKSVIRSDANKLTLGAVTITTDGNAYLYENLYVDGPGDVTIAGIISSGSALVPQTAQLGKGDLVKDGVGTLTISGSENTYYGRTFINSGTVVIDRETSLGSYPPTSTKADSLVIHGTLLCSGGSDAAPVTLRSRRGVKLGSVASDGGAIAVSSGNGLAISGIIANYATPNNLTNSGSGTLALWNANTYAGKTIITGGGTIKVGAENSLGSPATSASDSLTLDGGTLYATNTFTIPVSYTHLTLPTN